MSTKTAEADDVFHGTIATVIFADYRYSGARPRYQCQASWPSGGTAQLSLELTAMRLPGV